MPMELAGQSGECKSKRQILEGREGAELTTKVGGVDCPLWIEMHLQFQLSQSVLDYLAGTGSQS